MRNSIRGFTLIEMMVSVALFSVVMLVGMSALFTLVAENRRAQALNSVITDLNFTLESIARTIRTGYSYGCNGVTQGSCPEGGDRLEVTTVINDAEYRVEYRFREEAGRGFIERRLIEQPSGRGGNWVEITSGNVDIEEFNFFVFGSVPGDDYQPRVMIALSGRAERNEAVADFSIQTTVTQRVIDL